MYLEVWVRFSNMFIAKKDSSCSLITTIKLVRRDKTMVHVCVFLGINSNILISNFWRKHSVLSKRFLSRHKKLLYQVESFFHHDWEYIWFQPEYIFFLAELTVPYFFMEIRIKNLNNLIFILRTWIIWFLDVKWSASLSFKAV